MGVRWYNPIVARFFSEDPLRRFSGQTNLYLLDGNDPYAPKQSGIDWTKVGGPNADGHNVLSRTISTATGYADAFTFGITGKAQRYFYGDTVAESFQSNGYYTTGLVTGIAATIYTGTAAGNLLQAGRVGTGAYLAATTGSRAYRLGQATRIAFGAAGGLRGTAIAGWVIAGDIYSVGLSGYHLAEGRFSAIDLLGFAPTIGWAASAYRGARGFSRNVASSMEEAFSIVQRSGSNPRSVRWFDEVAVLEDIASSEVGRIVLNAAESNMFRLEFSRSFYRRSRLALAREFTNVEGIVLGNKAKVFLPAVGTNANAATKAIHEGLHAMGIAGSRRAEALVRLAEISHRGGVVDIAAMKKVLRDIRDARVKINGEIINPYSHLDWRTGTPGVGTTSPHFPGLEF